MWSTPRVCTSTPYIAIAVAATTRRGRPSSSSLGDAGSIKIKGGWVFAIRKLHRTNNSVIKRVQSVRHHSTSGAGCTLVSAQLTGFSCYWKDFASEWKRMTFLFDRQTDRQLGHLVPPPPPRAFANNPRGFCSAAPAAPRDPQRSVQTPSWENDHHRLTPLAIKNNYINYLWAKA